MSEPPVIETARTLLYLLVPDNAHLMQAYHRSNHMPSNVRSERLLARLGFEREGYARAYLKIAGRWEDMVLNSLINPGD